MRRCAAIAGSLLLGLMAVIAADPAAAASGGSAGPAAATRPLFTPDDLLLLEVYVGTRPLTDSINSFSSRAGLFLPLGELARLLDLSIVVDPPERAADGWVLSESRHFELDLDRGTATVDGNSITFGPGEATLFEDEIYVRIDLLQKLLPVALEVNKSELLLRITPRERLPFEDRADRERLHQSLDARGPDGPPATRVPVPYELFTPPAVDLNVSLGASNQEPKQLTSWELRAAGDVGYTGMQAYLASDDQGSPASARLLFERRSFGTERSPIEVARASVAGDVFTPSLTLGMASRGGRGFVVSSAQQPQASVFDSLDLRGELPPGYDVELYVNEVLRASQSIPVDGLYEFRDVPLTFGMNVIRLVFYGKHGERREEVRRINVGGGQLAAGETVSGFGIVDEGVPLFQLRSPTVDPRVFDAGYGKTQYMASIAHGFAGGFTGRLESGQYTPHTGGTRQIFNAGVSAALGGYAVQADASRDSLGGTAEALGLAGNVASMPVVLRHVEYQGGYMDENDASAIDPSNPMRRATDLRSDFTARLPGEGARTVPVSLTLRHAERADGATEWLANSRITGTAGAFLVSGGFNYDRYTGPGVDHANHLAAGVDAASIFAGSWQLRGSLAVEVMPTLQPLSTSVTVDRSLGNRSTLHLTAMHDLGDSGVTAVGAGLTWRFGFMDVTFNAGYATQVGLATVGLQFSMGSLFDPLRGGYAMVPPGAAASGALALDAFVDDDGDGRHDAAEASLAGLRAEGGGEPAVADEHGHLLVTGLGDRSPATVGLRLDSIEDPFLLPPSPSIEFAPRPGRVVRASYPVRRSGEATVRFVVALPQGVERGIAALDVELVDAQGKVACAGRTEYDGTVLFEALTPGTYTVRLDAKQSGRLHMSLADAVTVVVPAAGGYAGSIDAHVQVAR